MKAEIISIGTEITTGQSLNTNSQWLSLRLLEMGVATAFHTTVQDDLEDNVRVFRTAIQRAPLVLATGGLGPTLDDLTREALAKLAGVELIFHEASFRHIEALFASRRREMPARNRVQAMFPAGAEPISNPIGTAPGIWMKIGDAIVVAMPGVPTEMHLMFCEEVRPRLKAIGLGGRVLIERKINTFGAGESAIEEKLCDLTRRGASPEVGITASEATISLRILSGAATVAEAEEMCMPVEQVIRERLGTLVFGVGDEELQDVVLRQLAVKQWSIATAESMTAGLVAHKLAIVPGASKWLRGGVVCYDRSVKTGVLGVSESLLQAYGEVSRETAEALAVNIRAMLSADLGVSVVGYAGPDTGGTDKPVGSTFVAVAGPRGVKSSTFIWPGTRVEVQNRAAKMALNAVRLYLLGD